ncbi:MAG: hypothetical protein ACTSR8_03935 [Promethearchaeota archaeon]
MDKIQKLFEDYKPTKLKISSVFEFRFKKHPAWSSNQFKITHPNFYTDQLIEEYNRIFNAATLYLEGTPLKMVSSDSNLSQHIIKRVAREIIAGKNIIQVLKNHIRYNETLGLDLAILELKNYQANTKKIPLTTDKNMGALVNAVYKGYWKKFGIISWRDLIEHVFSKEQIIEWEELNRKELFDQAIIKLKNFFQKEKRLPKFSDKEVRDVINSIRTGLWIKYGINSWNDMLSYVFNDINSESKKYVGSDGLKLAINELKQYYKKEGKLPVYDDFISITTAIRRGYWKDLGIKTWNDLLSQIFGKINFTNNKYKGDEGFKLAIKVLKDFKRNNGRRPNNKDKGIGGIRHAVLRGEWRYKGINTWKDMIIYVFGEINSRWERYTGEKGLEYAVKKIREFKEKNQRVPRVKEKGLSGIKGAVYRGEWQSFDINNWNTLLLYAFGEINLSRKKYEGKIGLEMVAKILKEFKKKNNKIPRTTDNEMSSIKKSLYRGDWSIFGIKTWSNLLAYVFN